MDIRERTLALMAELSALAGQIPRDMRHDLQSLGVNMRTRMYEPRVRVRAVAPVHSMCTGKTAKGTVCKNKACAGFEMCRIHSKQSQRMTSEVEAVNPCTGTTAKGEPCKCPRFRGFEVCWRHAKKEGLLPDVPTDCAICMNDMVPSERTKTKCGHYFHTACLTQWATRRGTTSTSSRRRTIGAPCPMCRAPFRLTALPPPPIEGPAWYVMGNAAPTVTTSGAEWVERLRAVPTYPTMSLETLRHYAEYAGRRLLSFMDERNGEFPTVAQTRMIMDTHRIAPTVSYADL